MSQAQESQEQIKSSKNKSSNPLILNIVRNTSQLSIDKDKNPKILIKKKGNDSLDKRQQSIKKLSKSPKLNRTIDQSQSRSGTRINLDSQTKLSKNTSVEKRIPVTKRMPPMNPKLIEEKMKQSLLKKQLQKKEAELLKMQETANKLKQKLNSKVQIIKSGDQFQTVKSGDQFQTVKSGDQSQSAKPQEQSNSMNKISQRERSILVGVTSPENLNFTKKTQQYHTEYQNIRNKQYESQPIHQKMVTIASETSPLRHMHKPNDTIRSLNIEQENHQHNRQLITNHSYSPIRKIDDSRSPTLKLDLIPVRHIPDNKIFQNIQKIADSKAQKSRLRIELDFQYQKYEQLKVDRDQVKQERKAVETKLQLAKSEVSRLESLLLKTKFSEVTQKQIELEIQGQRARNDKLHSEGKLAQKGLEDLFEKTHETSLQINKDKEEQRKIILKSDHVNIQLGKIEQEYIQSNSKITRLILEIKELTAQENLIELQKDKAHLEILQAQKIRDDHVDIFDEKFQLLTAAERQLRKITADLSRDCCFSLKLLAGKRMCKFFDKKRESTQAMVINKIRETASFVLISELQIKALAIVLAKIDVYKKQNALAIWNQNILQPYKLLNQNYNLAASIHQSSVKQKCLFALWNYRQYKLDVYLSKSDGVIIVWDRLVQAARMELKRAIQIWADSTKLDKKKLHRFKKGVNLCYANLIKQALYKWKNYSDQVQTYSRRTLLNQLFIDKIYLNTVFQALRREVNQSLKHKVLIKENCLNQWKFYIQKQKYDLKRNFQIINFQQANETYIKKVCFQALLIQKTKIKQQCLKQDLQADVEEIIQKTEGQVQKFKEVRDKKEQTRTVSVIEKCLGAKLASYFNQWRKAAFFKDFEINNQTKQLIIRTYHAKLLQAFGMLRNNTLKKAKKKKKMICEEMVTQQNELVDQSLQIQNTQKTQAQAVQAVATKKNSKILRKVMNRLLSQAFQRWASTRDLHSDREQLLLKLCMKQHFRRQKHSFTVFKEFKQFQVRQEVKEKQVDNLLNTFNIRNVRKIYNAYCAFVHRQRRAKKYMQRILERMELWNLKRAFQMWNSQGTIKTVVKLTETQHNAVQNIESQQQFIGSSDLKINKQEVEIRQMDDKLKTQAHKIIGSYLIRTADQAKHSAFFIWRRRAMRKYIAYSLCNTITHHQKKQAFRKMAARISQVGFAQKYSKLEELKNVSLHQQSEIQGYIDHVNIQKKKNQETAAQNIQQIQAVQNFFQSRIDKVIGRIESKNKNWDFNSKKRLVFHGWITVARQQRAFRICIQNAIFKTHALKGFESILNHNRDCAKEKKIFNLCNKFMIVFAKTNLGELFCRWKTNINRKVNQKFQATRELFDNHIESSTQKSYEVKEQNTQNVHNFFKKRYLKKLYRSWQDYIYNLMMKRIKADESHQILASTKFKKALQKWFFRTQATLRRRQILKIMNINKNKRLLIMTFEALQWRKRVAFDLCKGLGNLEALFNKKQVEEGISSIRSFALSKKSTQKRRNRRGTNDVLSILCHRNFTLVERYFQRYKFIIFQKKQRNKLIKQVCMKMNCMNKRLAFRAWSDWSAKQVFAQEMNEVGPVTEEVFEARRTIYNLTDFMRSQRYPEEEIVGLKNRIADDTRNLMMKVVLRLKTAPEDRAKIYGLEHWKAWIKIKKLFKYYMILSNCRVQFGICDMRWAWDKWRKADSEDADNLSKQDIKALWTRNVAQSKDLIIKAANEAENNAILNHMHLQRSELLDHYIRAQKLALSAMKDSHRRYKGKAYMRWIQMQRDQHKKENAEDIRDSVQEIARTKGRIKRLEEDNTRLISENDQLRQFTIDGFTVAKNFQELAGERQKLTSDLADKSDQIALLMEQNKQLQEQLDILVKR